MASRYLSYFTFFAFFYTVHCMTRLTQSLRARDDPTTDPPLPFGLEMRPQNTTSRTLLQSYAPSSSGPLDDIEPGIQLIGTFNGTDVHGNAISILPRNADDDLYISNYTDTTSPGLSITVKTYKNITCDEPPYPIYRWTNGTVSNVTFKDIVSDITASNASAGLKDMRILVIHSPQKARPLLDKYYDNIGSNASYQDLLALDTSQPFSNWTVSFIGNEDYNSVFIYSITREQDPPPNPDVDYKSLAAAMVAFVATSATKVSQYLRSVASATHVDVLSIVVLTLVWQNLLKLAQESWDPLGSDPHSGSNASLGSMGLGTGNAEAANGFEPFYSVGQFQYQVDAGLKC